MASSVAKFVSASRKVGGFLLNSALISQAASYLPDAEMDRPTKLEFAVQMTCGSCVDQVRAALEGNPVKLLPDDSVSAMRTCWSASVCAARLQPTALLPAHHTGVTWVSINMEKEEVLVEATLTTAEVQALIESTGRRAVLKGIGSQQDLGAAVAMLAGVGPIQGVVRFVQLSEERCVIDGTIDGLEPGAHGLHVHTLGDLTQDCLSCGEHYNPFGKQHGGPGDAERHVGDLGNIVAGTDGRASFRLEDSQLKVWDVIGRSLVVDEGEDDLGRGGHPLSKQTGNSGEMLACGIIARSAGLFQNPKQICACDGVTLWEERDRPIAGTGRSKISTETLTANL